MQKVAPPVVRRFAEWTELPLGNEVTLVKIRPDEFEIGWKDGSLWRTKRYKGDYFAGTYQKPDDAGKLSFGDLSFTVYKLDSGDAILLGERHSSVAFGQGRSFLLHLGGDLTPVHEERNPVPCSTKGCPNQVWRPSGMTRFFCQDCKRNGRIRQPDLEKSGKARGGKARGGKAPPSTVQPKPKTRKIKKPGGL